MTTTTNDYIDVIDKHGKPTRRRGIMQDGDVLRVPIRLMDHGNPALMAAMAEAQAVKRIEQFDAAHSVGHRPGFGMLDAAATNERELLRDERNAKLANAWRKPPPAPTLDQPGPEPSPTSSGTFTKDELIARRDQRLENAWRY